MSSLPFPFLLSWLVLMLAPNYVNICMVQFIQYFYLFIKKKNYCLPMHLKIVDECINLDISFPHFPKCLFWEYISLVSGYKFCEKCGQQKYVLLMFSLSYENVIDECFLNVQNSLFKNIFRFHWANHCYQSAL